MQLSPEIDFLCACCRRSGAPGFPTHVRELSGRISRWSILIEKLALHGVDGLAYAQLQEAGRGVIPDEVLGVLADRAVQSAAISLRQISELADVLAELSSTSIVAVPFKGPLMAAALYGNPSLRRSVDLDFVIREQDRGTARAVLERRGYVLQTPVDAGGKALDPDKHEYHFEGTGKTAVEVRWRITQPQFGASLDLDYILPRCTGKEVAGLKILAIAPEDLLLILCAHGAKHRWERWMWLCDLEALMRSNPNLDWMAVRDRAAALGLRRVIRFSLILAHELLDAPVPEQLLVEAQADKEAVRLAAEVGAPLLGLEPPPETGAYHLRILDRRDHWRHNLQQWIRRMAPNEKDRQFVLLPKGLDSGYWLVRPVRLIWKRWASSGSGYPTEAQPESASKRIRTS